MSTITLYGIDPVKLKHLYDNNLEIIPYPRFEGIGKILNKTSIFNEVYPISSSNNMYAVNSKTGSRSIIATDSCIEPKGEDMVECWGCWNWFRMADNCGIFIDMEVVNGIYHIKRVGITCSHECSLAVIEGEKLKGKNMPIQYINSERYHNNYHALTNPDAPPLIPADNPRLLAEKGGSLQRKDWSSGKHRFIPTNDMVITEVKNTYMRKKIG